MCQPNINKIKGGYNDPKTKKSVHQSLPRPDVEIPAFAGMTVSNNEKLLLSLLKAFLPLPDKKNHP